MFKPQFAPMVLAGVKRQTVRPIPKRRPVIGEFESWREWIGKPYRSKQRELAQVEVVSAESISIVGDDVSVSGKLLQETEVAALALKDGFKTPNEFRNWFFKTHGLPFNGILIKAKDLEPKVTEI